MGQKRCIFVLLLLVLFLNLSCAKKDWTGVWEGTWGQGADQIRIAIDIDHDQDGNYRAFYYNIDDDINREPLNKVRAGWDSFHAERGMGESLDLKFNDRILQGTFNYKEQVAPVILRRGIDYLVPRLDPLGKAQTQYVYRQPRVLPDGWQVGDLRQTQADLSMIEAGIRSILDQTYPKIHSLLIVKGGKILLDEYFYGYGAQDEHPVQSITKSVFSLLVGITEDQGLIQLDQKLYDFFPECRSLMGWEEGKAKITLENLLTMTGGFECDDMRNSLACSWAMVKSSDWLAASLSTRLAGWPGRHFAYCGACLTPFSAILARQSGMALPYFAQKYLFEPLGIHQVHWKEGPAPCLAVNSRVNLKKIPPNDAGKVTPVSFGLTMRPRDLAKLGLLVLKKGKWKGKGIVSPQWISESTKERIPNTKTGKEAGYGYLWWTRALPDGDQWVDVIDGWGVGGQHLFIVPSLDMVCVVTGGNYKNGRLGGNAITLFEENVAAAFLPGNEAP